MRTFILLALILFFPGMSRAAEVDTVPDKIPSEAQDAEEALSSAGEIRPVPGVEPDMSPRDKRILRDLDREYEAGGLTRTEYIQRRRELKALDE